MKIFSMEFSNMSLAGKMAHAALFMSAISKEELSDYFNSSEERKRFLWQLKGLSSFWFDAKSETQPYNGGLFFEVRQWTNLSAKTALKAIEAVIRLISYTLLEMVSLIALNNRQE